MPLNNLNGWQRGWVVVAIVWTAVVLLSAAVTAPESPSRLKERQNERAAEAKRTSEESILVGGQWFPPDLPNDEIARMAIAMQTKIKTYPHDVALHVVGSAVIWAFPLIAIYLLGMGIAWIRAGFRRGS